MSNRGLIIAVFLAIAFAVFALGVLIHSRMHAPKRRSGDSDSEVAPELNAARHLYRREIGDSGLGILMADVTITVDGKKITAPAGSLLIEVCKSAGIEIPAFCYYPGLSLQAACRMCVVRQEKVPKLQTACTTQIAEGQVFFTDTPEVIQARKATLQLLLGNHPLDCPVCDAGGECELQDMTFKYGAADSFFAEPKNHREEQQWSPVVFYDRPRCILCYRCVRSCGEGMDVFALAVENRGSSSIIVPNVPSQLTPDNLAHLDCEQCGMCIDVCPVGALTSGTYRYKTRPWEMNHVATICTHCGDGCKTTLGVRSTADGSEIVRGDNRDEPRFSTAQREDIHPFAARPHAAVAGDSVRGRSKYTTGDHFCSSRWFFGLGVKAVRCAILESHVLQLALAACIAHRAVQRMVAPAAVAASPCAPGSPPA